MVAPDIYQTLNVNTFSKYQKLPQVLTYIQRFVNNFKQVERQVSVLILTEIQMLSNIRMQGLQRKILLRGTGDN